MHEIEAGGHEYAVTHLSRRIGQVATDELDALDGALRLHLAL